MNHFLKLVKVQDLATKCGFKAYKSYNYHRQDRKLDFPSSVINECVLKLGQLFARTRFLRKIKKKLPKVKKFMTVTAN